MSSLAPPSPNPNTQGKLNRLDQIERGIPHADQILLRKLTGPQEERKKSIYQTIAAAIVGVLLITTLSLVSCGVIPITALVGAAAATAIKAGLLAFSALAIRSTVKSAIQVHEKNNEILQIRSKIEATYNEEYLQRNFNRIVHEIVTNNEPLCQFHISSTKKERLQTALDGFHVERTFSRQEYDALKAVHPGFAIAEIMRDPTTTNEQKNELLFDHVKSCFESDLKRNSRGIRLSLGNGNKSKTFSKESYYPLYAPILDQYLCDEDWENLAAKYKKTKGSDELKLACCEQYRDSESLFPPNNEYPPLKNNPKVSEELNKAAVATSLLEELKPVCNDPFYIISSIHQSGTILDYNLNMQSFANTNDTFDWFNTQPIVIVEINRDQTEKLQIVRTITTDIKLRNSDTGVLEPILTACIETKISMDPNGQVTQNIYYRKIPETPADASSIVHLAS